MTLIKTSKCFEGLTQFWEHPSTATQTKMKFSTFIPEGIVEGCLIWLAGLTCTEENFITKAGAQKFLADHQLMIICPDTSPRGLNLPAEHDSWDFGSGASFYLDATTAGYKDHYKMETYIVKELHELIQKQFKISSSKISLMGHSMGGHGALSLGLRNPEKFRSLSAFSPIVNPMECLWGTKAFHGYLGEDKSTWSQHDTTELIKKGSKHPYQILVDQGSQDEFLEKQLLTNHLMAACRNAKQALTVNFHEGYDHSYYFISTFIESHIQFHAAAHKA